jgi:hypothetical protein
MASYIADLEAGRARVPEEWEIEGPAAAISLGDAADVDLAELAAMLGPDGLGGDVFAQDRSADVMRPGPVLAALTEQAAGDFGRLTDNQVLGALSAARRLAARAAWLELAAVAEFTRRREAQLADARARGVPRGCRDGEFPDAELACELVASANAARDTMGLATGLETRLPATRAALAAGLIEEYRARLIWRPTRHLTDADAAAADEILAPLAPGLRYDLPSSGGRPERPGNCLTATTCVVIATCYRYAGITIGASRPKAGGWNSPNLASWSGELHPGAPTPPPRPSTRCSCRRAIPLPLGVDYIRWGGSWPG